MEQSGHCRRNTAQEAPQIGLNRVSRRDIEIGGYHILRRWIPEVSLHVDQDHPDGVLGVYYVQGSAFFARLDLFRDIGYFDEIYHAFFEEVDLCRRALWRGYKLGLVTSLRLSHASRGAANRSRYRIYYRIRNKYLFILTDPDLGHQASWIVLRLIGADLRQIPGSSSSAEFSVLSFGRAVLWLLVHASQIARSKPAQQVLGCNPGSPSLTHALDPSSSQAHERIPAPSWHRSGAARVGAPKRTGDFFVPKP